MSSYEVALKTRIRSYLREIFFISKYISSFVLPGMISPFKLLELSDFTEYFVLKNNQTLKVSVIESRGDYRFEKYKIYNVSNAVYIQHSQVTILNNKFVIADQHPRYGLISSKKKIDFYLNNQFFKRSRVSLESPIVAIISTKNSSNYFHYIFDEFVKLLFLIEAGFQEFSIITFFGKEKLLIQILKFLNINLPVIQFNKKKDYFISEVLLPDYPSKNEFITKQKIELFNKYFSFDQSHQAEELIYISREDASIRRLSNEVDVIALIQPMGFRTVLLSTLSFEAQVQLFRSAKMIIAPHGAGLTNLLFCMSTVKVLELIPSNKYFSPNLFETLCVFKEIDYMAIVGVITDPIYNDFSIDLLELKKTFNGFLKINAWDD